MGHCETFIIFLIWFLFLGSFCVPPSSQDTRCQPVNIAMIAALPWDISNTLRAPLGGPVSLGLSVIMAMILLFGFILSPINYILGYPPRIYHGARQPGIISKLYPLPSLKIKGKGRSIEPGDLESFELPGNISSGNMEMWEFSENLANTSVSYPDFMSTVFLLLPELDPNCQKVILCHAHGFLQIFPTKLTKLVRYFSKRLKYVPDEYKSAVLIGLNDQDNCHRIFKCEKEISVILKETLYHLISDEIKKLWNLRKLF